MNTSKIINTEQTNVISGTSGNSGSSGTSCYAGCAGLSDIVRTINKAFNELKIEEDYSYSYDSRYSMDYKSITYIIKLLNKNNEEIHTIELTNITNHKIFLDKIKLNLKQYFRDINLNKLIK